MEKVLITGVSGGMGLETLKEFLSLGHQVIGLDIKKPELEDKNFIFHQVDLTNIESIEKIYNDNKEEFSNLSAIIHLAGIYDLNSLIEMKEEDFVRIFNINVFSIYRINRTFVSSLKKKGKIIIISSELAPLDPLPFTGIYGITKTTIEKYAYSLRMELQLLDKQVVVIRPGAVDTGLLNVSTTKLDKFCESTTNYSYNATRFKNIVDKVEAKKISPSKIAKLIAKVFKKKNPKYIYKINRNPLLRLLNIMPKRFQNWVIKKILISK